MAHKILVVEDSPTQAERVRHLLEGEGYEVVLARRYGSTRLTCHCFPPTANSCGKCSSICSPTPATLCPKAVR